MTALSAWVLRGPLALPLHNGRLSQHGDMGSRGLQIRSWSRFAPDWNVEGGGLAGFPARCESEAPSLCH